MTVTATPFGPAAFDALAAALRAVRDGDRLLSVHVAVPSSFVGVSVRRRLVRRLARRPDGHRRSSRVADSRRLGRLPISSLAAIRGLLA